MAELLLKKGEVVVATARKPEALDDLKAKYPARQLVTVKLNVDNARQIKDAFSRAKAAFGRIDVVFNNAGWSVMGETEGTPEDVARKLFDTNFWGAANVSREAVKFFSIIPITHANSYVIRSTKPEPIAVEVWLNAMQRIVIDEAGNREHFNKF